MARESFSDPDTAAVMNREFVNIKVDREERPDLDRVHQLAFQALNGRGGGWPLTVFLTPDDHMPFFAGTYFPPRRMQGMPAFAEILEQIAAVWRDRREAVRTQNAELQGVFDRPGADAEALSRQPIDEVVPALEDAFDPENGGLGGAPKFPHPGQLRLALEAGAGTRNDADRARRIAERTLTGMARGGLFDQVGGGFARYSVDARWEIPHFEKMLCDNGLLLGLYADAAVAHGRADFAATARATADWLLREMRLPGGGFCASLDADSEGGEGRFYTWSEQEIAAALADLEAGDVELVRRHFGFDRAPNFEGRWHPVAAVDVATLAQAQGCDEATVARRVERGRAALLAARERREHPHRDDKVLTAWNAFAAEGLAIARRRLGEPAHVDAALACVDFLRDHLFEGGRLHAVWRGGTVSQPGFVDDHAVLLCALHETLRARWRDADLALARELADTLIERFGDRERGGFFQTADDHEALPYRPRPSADESTPSGNGPAALGLARLGHLLAEPRYLEAARGALEACMSDVRSAPMAHATLVRVLAHEFDPPEQILVRGERARLTGLAEQAAASFRPGRFVFTLAPDAGAALETLPEVPADGIVAIRCRGMTCDVPLTDGNAIAAMITG